MIHQNEIREKLREIKSGVKDLWKKFNANSEKRNSVKSDDGEETSMYEFTPDNQVATSPRTKAPLTDRSNDAQNVVWDNEDASMQDKSYSFDEETTATNYDRDDENDVSDQENRYK